MKTIFFNNTNMLSKALLLLFLLCANIFVFGQNERERKILDSLAGCYKKALADWEVPGMAVAIVKEGKVIFSEGFGVRNINEKTRVDSKTMFPIASNTKAFTAASLAILVDEGKIDWQDKVVDYIPWFQLYDPYVTASITIRDLLCHRSGLATFSGDLVWYGSAWSRNEVIRRARYLKPVYGFREHFGYSNIMYLTAGEIIPAVTGTSWDNFIIERFFKPLGMTRTITSTNDLPKFSNVATAHTDITDADGSKNVIPIEFLNWDNIAPAGSIISCVDDMAQWLILQLNRGIFEGDTIFTPARSREMWSANTVQDISRFSETYMPSTHFRAYGLGWGINDYKGHKIVGHSGGYDGMISYTCLVPDINLGFVILTNKNSSLYYPMMLTTLDAFLGGETRDWSQFMLERIKQGEAGDRQQRQEWEQNRIKNTLPSLRPEDYCGIYESELYGEASVRLTNGQLMIQFVPTPALTGTLTHWHYDTFEIEFKPLPSLPKGTCTFGLDANGKVEKMKIDVPNPDFDFTELDFRKKD